MQDLPLNYCKTHIARNQPKLWHSWYVQYDLLVGCALFNWAVCCELQTCRNSYKLFIVHIIIMILRYSLHDQYDPWFLGLLNTRNLMALSFQATCSADGNVRIYEAPDLTDLTTWEIQDSVMTKMSCSCLSWNPSR